MMNLKITAKPVINSIHLIVTQEKNGYNMVRRKYTYIIRYKKI